MNVLEYFVANYAMELIGIILTAIVGTLGYAAKNIYQTYINDETKRHIASAAVEFVEQAWKILHGPEKLQKALETAQMLLEKKGIDFDAEEMTVLIEAILAEFNDAFHKSQALPVPDSDTSALYSAPESNADPYALMGFDHDDGSGLLE